MAISHVSRTIVCAYWAIGLVISWSLLIDVFASALNVDVRVQPIQSAADIQHLDDLRYNEWIRDQYPDTSQSGFAMATAELYHERAADGAVGFLAMESKSRLSKERPSAMGAGELSPIEFDGAINTQIPENEIIPWFWYITDVVTAREHRRQGVARALMDAMEDYAAQSQPTNQQHKSTGDCRTCCLLLHVESSNEPALAFYESLGYTSALPPILENILDTHRLESNAGTQDQLLLCKLVETPSISIKTKPRNKPKKNASSGRGFGK